MSLLYNLYIMATTIQELKIINEPKTNPKVEFEQMVENYLASNPMNKSNNKSSEMEVRFGTNPKVAKPLSKIDYDNVVQKLYAAGFTCNNIDGLHILRIQNEYTDPRLGVTKISNIRGEIVGIDMIQEYCKTNSIQKLLDMPSTMSARSDKIKFTQKTPPGEKDDPIKPIRNVDFADFNFRVAYQMEQDFSVRTNIAKNIIGKWNDSKKIFRYINRVRFSHPVYPVYADISIVRGSKKTNRIPIPQYTIQEAEVFTNAETFEIELEIANERVGIGTNYNTKAVLVDAIRRCIRIVLGGIQGTNYPIGYDERDKVLQSYMKMIHGEHFQPRRVYSRDFIGPQSFTLQVENIMTEDEGANIPNIRRNYTVTDKADGERRLLFVSSNGRIYMVDSNMNVIFTGSLCLDKTLYNSLIDGEFIKYDKRGNSLNLYAAFDIYYYNNISTREFGFTPMIDTDEIKKFRLPLLNKLVQRLKPQSIMAAVQPQLEKESGMPSETDKLCDFSIKCKQFYSTNYGATIFEGCSRILSDVKDGLFEYTTDGLIFTPIDTGVGSNRIGISGPLYKSTWDYSFKWKPPQFNTIDFLVSIKKDKTGKDEIHNIFEDSNFYGVSDVKQYKTIILRCGFDERKHGYLNPQLDIINDKIHSTDELDNEETYKPVPFQPTNPFDATACYSNVQLYNDGTNLILKTEENEYFEEDMIVEFKYDESKIGAWKWIPLRVRYDKTSELRAGMKNYGNAYHVANNNWTSIHNPITNFMISTGQNIPEFTAATDDIYYNRSSSKSNTKALRDFHNLFVKRRLILGVAQRRDTLIDYAVGKAGDLSKWDHANLAFVLGIDISKDNIQNNLDGACARYLTMRKKYKHVPDALFLNGNSGANIRNGDAFSSVKDREISRAIFGEGPKDQTQLGKGVYKQYGIAHYGFQISSVQFALHYFFENTIGLHKFIRNLSECTKVNGYFIGTCYDGATVFNLLNQKNEGESITIMDEDIKIYEITKRYSQTGFPDDDNSLGYSIDIFQETINKVFREYLVNYNYLIRIMEDYGFSLVPSETARKMGLPNNSGLFDELYTSMENEIKRNPERTVDFGFAKNMSYSEKRISFMNRYFIFQKMRNVNTEKMFKQLELKGKLEEPEVELEEPIENPAKTYFRKLKVPKIVIADYEPVESESSVNIPPATLIHNELVELTQQIAPNPIPITNTVVLSEPITLVPVKPVSGNVVTIIRKTKKNLPKKEPV